MMDAAGIAEWIQDLAGSDARLKSESGVKLYLAGVRDPKRLTFKGLQELTRG